jgi:NADPH:quinone reductase-like Zn-dependent oxidoreductase
MKAVRFHDYGSTDVLRYESVDEPSTDDGEVLLRVRACAINHVDIDIRNGSSRLPITLPHILGIEISGEVIEAPAGTGLTAGQRVAVLYQQSCGSCENCLEGHQELCPSTLMPGIQRSGGYAERIRVPARALIPISDALSFEDAASIQTTYGTAWHALIVRANLQPGETVLVSAAGSGVGSAAIHIAKWAGARVIASAGSEPKLEKALAHGADFVINYMKEETTKRVRELTNGRGVDVAFEHVGGEVFTSALRSVRRGGRITVVGGHGGEVVPLDLINLFRDQVAILGCVRATQSELVHVIRLAERGVFKPVVHEVLPLREAARAHQIVEGRQQYGKVVLRPE